MKTLVCLIFFLVDPVHALSSYQNARNVFKTLARPMTLEDGTQFLLSHPLSCVRYGNPKLNWLSPEVTLVQTENRSYFVQGNYIVQTSSNKVIGPDKNGNFVGFYSDSQVFEAVEYYRLGPRSSILIEEVGTFSDEPSVSETGANGVYSYSVCRTDSPADIN